MLEKLFEELKSEKDSKTFDELLFEEKVIFSLEHSNQIIPFIEIYKQFLIYRLKNTYLEPGIDDILKRKFYSLLKYETNSKIYNPWYDSLSTYFNLKLEK